MKINSMKKLHEELNKIAPTRYSHFTGKQPLPFITYIDDGEDNFHADNVDLKTGKLVRVELYTEDSDFDLEEEIKQIFREYEIGFDKQPTQYIDSEEMFMAIFDIKLVY